MRDIRKTLDELLGKERNKPLNEKIKSKTHFDQPEICKFFLLDFCPYELFTNTKNDIGVCKKKHDTFLQKQFVTNSNKEQYKRRYEEQLKYFLESLLSDLNIKIKRLQERIDAPLQETDKPKDILEQIEFYDRKIEDLLVEVDRLGELGMITESELVMKQIDIFREKKLNLINMSDYNASKDQQLKICEVCGALQSVLDNESRLQTHNEGRLHTGYVKVREYLEKLKIKEKEKEEAFNNKLKSPNDGIELSNIILNGNNIESRGSMDNNKKDQRKYNDDYKRDYHSKEDRRNEHYHNKDYKERDKYREKNSYRDNQRDYKYKERETHRDKEKDRERDMHKSGSGKYHSKDRYRDRSDR